MGGGDTANHERKCIKKKAIKYLVVVINCWLTCFVVLLYYFVVTGCHDDGRDYGAMEGGTYTDSR